MPLIFLLVLALFQGVITNYLLLNPDYYQLGAYTWESNAFREMRFGDGLENCRAKTGAQSLSDSGLDFDQITTLMIEHDYDMGRVKDFHYKGSLLPAARPADYRKLRSAYETVLGDLVYFPIPLNEAGNGTDVTFSDSWLAGRSYISGKSSGAAGMDQADAGEGGGAAGMDETPVGEDSSTQKAPARSHEGCDIMGPGHPRGYYPVVSMSDGIIERVGWLEMGGWRIGIRSPGGAYLYYAHLYSYAGDFKEGDLVKAGDLIGYMGDSGYGKAEGTVGNFDVHLHVGIYLKTDHYQELSVNPYWILKFLEGRRLRFRY